MARNIDIYVRPLGLQNHKDANFYHKATLRLKEDEKILLIKIKN